MVLMSDKVCGRLFVHIKVSWKRMLWALEVTWEGPWGKEGPRSWKDLRIPPAGICVRTVL